MDCLFWKKGGHCREVAGHHCGEVTVSGVSTVFFYSASESAAVSIKKLDNVQKILLNTSLLWIPQVHYIDLSEIVEFVKVEIIVITVQLASSVTSF